MRTDLMVSHVDISKATLSLNNGLLEMLLPVLTARLLGERIAETKAADTEVLRHAHRSDGLSLMWTSVKQH